MLRLRFRVSLLSFAAGSTTVTPDEDFGKDLEAIIRRSAGAMESALLGVVAGLERRNHGTQKTVLNLSSRTRKNPLDNRFLCGL